MTAVLDGVSAALVLLGSIFAFTAAVGLVRFPDTISRMHPSTKTQVFGLILVLIGALIRLRDSMDVGMLVLAGMFTVIVSPVFAHLVGRTAYREGGMHPSVVTRDEMPEHTPAQELADDDTDYDDDDGDDDGMAGAGTADPYPDADDVGAGDEAGPDLR